MSLTAAGARRRRARPAREAGDDEHQGRGDSDRKAPRPGAPLHVFRSRPPGSGARSRSSIRGSTRQRTSTARGPGAGAPAHPIADAPTGYGWARKTSSCWRMTADGRASTGHISPVHFWP